MKPIMNITLSLILLIPLLSCADEQARSKASGAAAMFMMLLPSLSYRPPVATEDKAICDPIRADDPDIGTYLQEGVFIQSDQYNIPDTAYSRYILKPAEANMIVNIEKIGLNNNLYVKFDYCMGSVAYISNAISLECNNRAAPYDYFFLGETSGVYINECRIRYSTSPDNISAIYVVIEGSLRDGYTAADYEHSVAWNQY